MKTITIGLSTSKLSFPIFSWLIKLSERTNFSHVYLRLPKNKYSSDLIYHASGVNVYFMGEPAFNLYEIPIKEYTMNISDESYTRMVDYAINKSGMPYSYKQIVGMLFKRIAKMFGKDIQNPFATSGYICTELVSEILKNFTNIDIVKSSNDIDLNDIEHILDSAIPKENIKIY